jgi:hypothetical protein
MWIRRSTLRHNTALLENSCQDGSAGAKITSGQPESDGARVYEAVGPDKFTVRSGVELAVLDACLYIRVRRVDELA